MATDSELLIVIDAAIIDILENGQTVNYKGTLYDKANVNSLFDRRKELSGAINRASTGFFGNVKTIIPRRYP